MKVKVNIVDQFDKVMKTFEAKSLILNRWANN